MWLHYLRSIPQNAWLAPPKVSLGQLSDLKRLLQRPIWTFSLNLRKMSYKILGIVVHASRGMSTLNVRNLSFPHRTFLWSCHCPRLLQRYIREAACIGLYFRKIWHPVTPFHCIPGGEYLNYELYRQNPQTSTELKQYISAAACEIIPAVTLVRVSENFVFRLTHVVPAVCGCIENIIIKFLYTFSKHVHTVFSYFSIYPLSGAIFRQTS